MASKGITIAISGTYNGRALEKARQDLEKMQMTAITASGQAGSSLINLGQDLADVGGAIHNVGYKMERFGNAATTYITLPIAAAAAACASAAITIDDSLTSVKKTVDGTEEQYQQLKKAAIEFSKTNAVSADQILDIQALGAQLGYAITELDEFSRVVSGLDIATDMDAETAATELAQFANITKMAHEETSNYGSTIVALGNNLATTESQVSAMAQRLAAAGTQVGMSEADILGLSGALTSLGLNAEAGGTAVSTVMSQIDKDIATNSDNVAEWAKAAGMSAEDFATAWKKDPVKALSALLAGMEAATEEGSNMSVMLDDLGVSSLRQTDALKRMAGNSELVADAVELANDAWQENTALQKEVDNRNASMSSRLKILQHKVTAVAESVGTPLVNALLEVVDDLEPLLKGVADAAQAFADMDDESQKTVLRLAAVAAGIGPVTSVAGKLTQGIGDLIVGFGNVAQHGGLLVNEFSKVGETISLVAGGAGTVSEGFDLVMSETTILSGGISTLSGVLAALPWIAVAAGVAALVTEFIKLVDHEQTVVDATYGLETAMGAASEAYNGFSVASDTVVTSTSDVIKAADDCIQKQADLAQSARDTWSEYGTNAAQVDYYAGIIEELAHKTGLTEEEQFKLKNAVDQFNELTGTSIQVIDAENGLLSDSVSAIKATTEAYKERARTQAAAELYNETIKQQLQNEAELEQVSSQLTDTEKKFADAALSGNIIAVIQYGAEMAQLQAREEELTKAVESNNTTSQRYLEIINGSGQKFDSLKSALDSTGTKWQEFGMTSQEQWDLMDQSFDGTLTSIINSCNEQGLKIPRELSEAINKTASEAEKSASGLGKDIDEGIAKGIEDNEDKPKNGLEAVGEAILNGFKSLFGINSPSKVMADLGKNIDEGLANGINNNKGTASTATTNLGQAIKSAIQSLPSTLQGIGQNAGNLLSSGLSGTSGSVRSAGSTLSKSAQSGLDSVKDQFKTTGTTAGTNFKSGLGSVSTYGAGQTLANNAKSGLGSVSTYGAGQNFTTGFKNGMGSVSLWNAAYNLGMNALGAIKSALGIASPSKEAEKVGEWFGEGAIIGMKSTEASIAAEAKRMSGAMALSPSMATNYTSDYTASVLGYQGAGTANKQFSFNVTVNVNATNAEQAARIGRSLGDELYLEFARRERAYA